MQRLNNFIKNTVVDTINETTIKGFINQKVLLETHDNKIHTGIFNKFKNNYGIFNENGIKIACKLDEITKISGVNTNTSLFETIVKCGSGNNSYCVKSKKGKNLGGPYKSKDSAEKRIKQVEYFKHMKEDIDLLIKEKLLHKFFKINEEIVNPDNKGKLTKDRQSSRDKKRYKSPAKDAKPVKGPPGRMDTPEEAKYRFATYLELRSKK